MDMNGKRHMHPWCTSSESYGAFEGWEPHKISVSQLPKKTKSIKQIEQWKMTRTTASEYGNFYDESSNGARREYKVKPNLALPAINEKRPLPPIVQKQKPVQREVPEELTLKLPDIVDMAVQFTTRDYQAVTVYPEGEGRFESQTIPHGLESITLPDIKDINVKFRMRDGKTFNFPSSPRFSTTFGNNQAWIIEK